MNMTHLQIGDWIIEDYNYTCDKVETLNDCEVTTLNWDYGQGSTSYKGIRLTADILKANHFVQEDAFAERYVYIFKELGFISVDLDTDRIVRLVLFARDIDIKMPILYVHELQNLLRLCGCDDMADNFKIKK